jgi:4,5-DOPA dioxygenase extradiol
MSRLPALFISHGAPTLVITPGAARDFLGTLGQALPRPEAILAISAHWETAQPTLGSAMRPTTIHDFRGFPREMYEITYPAVGSPVLANRAVGLLAAAGLAAREDAERGLDHGAWVPLALMYPDARIPVTQLSIQTALGADHHYRIGQALEPLRSEGVLILASGSATHNLGELRWDAPDDAPAWVLEFREWLASSTESGDLEALLDYRAQAPNAVRNHPSEEHLLPFFVALGAGANPAHAKRIHASTTYGVLAMDAYRFD